MTVALTVSGVLGEAVVRGFVQMPLRRVMPEVRYVAHPVRRYTLKPEQTAYTYGGLATIDRRGFRLNRAGARPGAESATVLALGDSFTFGLGVTDGETWPGRLEAALCQRTSRDAITVLNAGTIGYGVFQEMDLLRTAGLQMHPRIVIHELYWNDYMNAAPPTPADPPALDADGYFVWDRLSQERGLMRRAAAWISARSALVSTVRQAVTRATTARSTSAYSQSHARLVKAGLGPDDWRPIKTFYQDLIALGREQNFAVVVVIMPVIDIVSQPGADRHPYAVAARRLLTELGVPSVDAFTLWARNGYGRERFLPQGPDAHLNEAGYRTIAEAAADALVADPSLRKRLE